MVFVVVLFVCVFVCSFKQYFQDRCGAAPVLRKQEDHKVEARMGHRVRPKATILLLSTCWFAFIFIVNYFFIRLCFLLEPSILMKEVLRKLFLMMMSVLYKSSGNGQVTKVEDFLSSPPLRFLPTLIHRMTWKMYGGVGSGGWLQFASLFINLLGISLMVLLPVEPHSAHLSVLCRWHGGWNARLLAVEDHCYRWAVRQCPYWVYELCGIWASLLG